MDLRNLNPKPVVKKTEKQPDLHYRIPKKKWWQQEPLVIETEELNIARSVQCLPKKQISRSPPLYHKAK